MVSGTRGNAEALRRTVASTLARWGCGSPTPRPAGASPRGLRLPRLAHPAQAEARHQQEPCVHTYPSKTALRAIKAKAKRLTHRSAFPTLFALLHRLNPALRGWAAYFQHGLSKRTFSYLGEYAFWRVVGWLRKRHRGTWASLRRRYLRGWRPTQDGISLYNPATVAVTRYRYRGTAITTPWTATSAGA